MKQVRITVLRKEFYPELAEEYLTEGAGAGPCPLLEVGDSFLYQGGAVMPEGFCPWAWMDIYRSVNAISLGASHRPWTRQDGRTVDCCTDGIRPVVFEVRAEE